MQIKVSGKHIDVGEALSAHVNEKLSEVAEKYSGRAVDGSVTFSKDAHEYVCDASVHLSSGMTANAKGRANDIYDSFEIAANRMEKQLRRYKRRLKDHHKERTSPIEAFNAPSYVLASAGEADVDEAEPDTLQPVIIAEMETRVQTLSVGEAVMQMEIAHSQLLVFRNSSHGGVNVVYQRDDGNIGWIDPRSTR